MMPEWWSYSLEDFLLFAPRTYYRLFELYNAAIWPAAHVLAGALGLTILLLLLNRVKGRERAIAVVLAAGWSWVAWAYFLERYATINWAAPYFAYGFLMQALVLILIGAFWGRLALPTNCGWIQWIGAGLFLFALLLQPLIGPLIGRSWLQTELFGLAPDPTVAGSLAVIVISRHWSKYMLLIIPFFWCVVSGATLWAMNAPDALVMPLIAVLAILVIISDHAFNR